MGLQILADAQRIVYEVLGLAALALAVYSFVDACRYPQQAYVAAGKLTKTWWLVILGVSAAVAFATMSPLGLVGLIGIVACGVYLADVRPALRAVSPRRRNRRASGSGPYGSW